MTDAARANERIATERMSRISKLIGDENFRWFIREAVIAKQEAQKEIVLRMTTGSESRELAVAVWNALEDIRKWADKERASCGQTLGHGAYLPVDFST